MSKKKSADTASPVDEQGPLAPAPPRVYSKTTLTLGLASIEVEFMTGTEAARTSRGTFVQVEDGEGGVEFHAVGNKHYDKVTGADVDKDAVVKGVAVDDQIVVITDQELASFGMERGTAPITGFVPRKAVQQSRWLLPSQIYQTRAAQQRVGKEKRPNRAAEKLYSLLLRGLERHDVVALVPLALRDGGAKRYGLLDHTGRLSIMHYADELREEAPLVLADTTPEEDGLMDQLVEKHGLAHVPLLRNESEERLRALIDHKIAGGEVVSASDDAPLLNPDEDVSALLRASLEG